MKEIPFKKFVWAIFVANEIADRRYSDSVLESVIRSHYSDSDLDRPLGRHPTRLRVWRSEYNRGLLPMPPQQMSFRYNDRHWPCNQYGNPLSLEQIESRLYDHTRRGYTDSILRFKESIDAGNNSSTRTSRSGHNMVNPPNGGGVSNDLSTLP